ncbi:hypothetical protein AVEN_139124-1 [Araneus ventricosus]|uniref:Uncharacterized protein n=1 Tax=Araneus ventricosus TaxID=182803 RepID=A0A4Y2L5H7_ARAVE|nr:hypothetical protein AVEN_139124-1 [Araneus ventricosus]
MAGLKKRMTCSAAVISVAWSGRVESLRSFLRHSLYKQKYLKRTNGNFWGFKNGKLFPRTVARNVLASCAHTLTEPNNTTGETKSGLRGRAWLLEKEMSFVERDGIILPPLHVNGTVHEMS